MLLTSETLRAFAQHRFGDVKALEHQSLHCATMCLVKGMKAMDALDRRVSQLDCQADVAHGARNRDVAEHRLRRGRSRMQEHKGGAAADSVARWGLLTTASFSRFGRRLMPHTGTPSRN
jgi:hypothetical protein